MKKKVLIGIISSIVTVGGGVGAYLYVNASQPPAEIEESEAKFQTTYLEVPTDGSTPLDYDATTNIAYALWQLEQEDSFYSYTRGISDASVATIQIYSERTVIGDVALTETISDGMISNGSQYYFIDNKVLLRNADKVKGLDTLWSNGDPECISNSTYLKRHGWLPYKCGAYIICEETILSASEIKNNGDGTFSFKLELNPDNDYAPFWYQREILTNSGSSIIPKFKFINIEYKINADWQIQEVHVVEEYKVKAMGIEASSKTDTIEYFSYDNVKFDDEKLAYFSKYEDLQPAEGSDDIVREDDVLTMITSSLQNADGSDEILDISISVGDNKLDGLVSLNISDLNNVKVKALLSDIYVEYSDAIYISIGGVKVKATMDDINSIIGVFATGDENSTEEAASPALDVAQIIADLNGAEVIKNEDGTDISVSAKLNLLGIELPLNFHFSYIDGVYSIIDASVNLVIEGTEINVELGQTDKTIPAVDYSSYAELSNLQFVFDEVGNIISEKKLGAKLNVSYDELNVTADLKLDFADGIKACADINVAYKELNEALKVYFIDNSIYLNYDDAKLMISLDDLMALLEKYTDINLSDSVSIDLNSIIGTILSIDFNELLKDFTLAEEKLGLKINLKQFVESMSEIQIGIEKESGVKLSVIMDSLVIDATLSTYEGEIAIEGEYDNLANLDYIIEDVLSIIEAKKVKLELTGAYENITLALEANIDFSSSLALNASIVLSNGNNSVEINVTYLEEVIYLDFYNVKFSISVDDLLRILEKCGVSFESDESSVTTIIDTVLAIDFSQLLEEIRVLEDSTSITVNLEQFIADMEAITVSISDTDNGLNLAVSMFDINLAISSFTEDIVVSKEYQNLGFLEFVVDDVLAIINNSKVSANITGSYEGINLKVEAKVDWTNSLALQANIKIAKEDKEINLVVSYIGEVVYLEFYNVKVCISVEDFLKILDKCGVSLDTNTINVEEIINIIFEIDYSALIKEFSILENEIELIVGLEQFVSDMDAITVSISDTDNGLNLSLDMFDINCSIEQFDGSIILSGEYMDLSNLFFIVDDILAIVDSKKVELSLSGAYEGINISVNAKVDFTDSIKLSGVITISNQTNEVTLNLAYLNNSVYLDLEGTKVMISVDDLLRILEKCGVTLNTSSETQQVNINDIVDTILSINYSELIKNLTITEETLEVTLGLQQFIADMEDITLSINNQENGLGLTLSMFEIEATVTPYEGEIVVSEGYQNLGYLDFIVDDILSIVDSKKVEVALEGSYENISLAANAYVDFTEGLKAYIKLNVVYDTLSLDLDVRYFDKYTINGTELSQVIFIDFKNVHLYLTVSELMKTLGKEEQSSQESSINIAKIIDMVLSIDFASLISDLIIEETEINLDINLEQFGLDLGELIDITRAIQIKLADIENGLELSIPDVFGLSIKVFNGITEEVSLPENNYIELNKLIDDILYIVDFIKNQSINLVLDLSANVNINGTNENISANAVLDIVNNEGVYSVGGTITVTALGANISIDLYVINDSIYLTLFGQSIQLSFDALGALVTNVTEMTSSNGSANSTTIDLGKVNSILDSIVFTDSTSLKLSLNELVSSLSTIAINLAVDRGNSNIDVNINEINNVISLSLSASISDKTEIIAPEAEVFTADDINNLFNTINVLIDKFNINDAFTLNIDADIYGINIIGLIEINKNLDIYASISASVEDELGNVTTIELNVKHVNEKLYIDFNGLCIMFTYDDFNIIIDSVTELVNAYMNDEQNSESTKSGLDIAEIVESILFGISSHSFTAEGIAIGLTLDILSMKGIEVSLGATNDGISLSGKINEDIIINNLSATFGMTEKELIDDSKYLAVSSIVNIFENLENGILFDGEIKLELGADLHVILPYSMSARIDLVDLLKAENAFSAIDLELVIDSELYDPIVLTIVDGFIYLDSMGTKFKYEIPQYNLKDAIAGSSNTETQSAETTNTVDINALINDIFGYINGIEFITSADTISILLSNDLMATLNDMILNLTGMELNLSDLGISVTNITDTTFSIALVAEVNAMGMDIKFSLVNDSVLQGYVSSLTEEQKAEFILTKDFAEHPFAIRVLDIIDMVKGIIAFDYSVNGQQFNLNVPLKVDSGLVDTCNANGSLGVWLDIQSVLDGGDIMSAFKFAVDVNIKAKMPWYLFGAKVNIDIQVFAVGDGYIYVIIDGNAVGIGFSILEMVMDLAEDPASDLSVGQSSVETSILYLNDFINNIINGFETYKDGNVTSLSLSPKSAEAVNEIWRMVVEMVLAEVDTLGVEAVTNLMKGIVNFNMDVTDLTIDSALTEQGEFDYLKIILDGYRHGTFDATSLPITVTHSGELSATYFDSYQSVADGYASVKEEIKTAKSMISELGQFTYSADYYNKLVEIQTYLNGMSEVAIASYSPTIISEMKLFYEQLQTSETLLRSVIDTYKASGVEGLTAADVINCYEAYLYFQVEGIVLTEEEFELYEQIYNEVAQAELLDFNNSVLEFNVITEPDAILADLDTYFNELNVLVTYYVGLSHSYKDAFALFYSEANEKLLLAMESYNAFASDYINVRIYSYLGDGYETLADAQTGYANYGFTTMKGYLLYSYENIANWDTLNNYIYTVYISDLDKRIGSELSLGVVSSLVASIPELEKEYSQYIDEFKALFKYDIITLSSKYDAAVQKYKEDILALDLANVFGVTYSVADSGYFATDDLHYYDFKLYNFSDAQYATAQKVYELYDISIRANINVKDYIDEYYVETLFMFTYYFYKFADMVNDSSVLVEDINSIVNEMTNSNTYEIYTLKKRIGLSSYYCDKTTTKAFFTMFTESTSGSYFYTIYQQYLSRIA